MEKLSPSQLERIYIHLLAASPNNVLQEELLDHLACEVEQLINNGQSFEKAWSEVSEEASIVSVRCLEKLYQNELTLSGERLRQADLTELVFEYRNKAYGAYPLRQAYPTHIVNALLAGTGIFIILLAGLTLLTS